MVVSPRALSIETLGAWLLKASGAMVSTHQHVEADFVEVEQWCVRPTYRTGLVAADQPALLWVSGTHRHLPAGIYAHGRTTGHATATAMPLFLEPLERPLLRAELAAHPGLARLEVLRMPAGSNPSYVTKKQLLALTELSPGLQV